MNYAGKYGESGHKRRRRRLNPLFVVTVLAAVLLVLVLVAVLLNLEPKLYDVLTVEAGGNVPQAQSFLAEDKDITLSYASDISGIKTDVPGDYPVKVQWDKKTADVTIRVVDTMTPVGMVQDLTAPQDKLPAAEDFVTVIDDATAVTVTYEKAPDANNDQPQSVVILLTDAGGNTARLTAMLTVIIDKQAPTITGAVDVEVYQDKAVAYRNGITVTDDLDDAPVLSVDSSAVNLSVPGKYPVIYTATDAAGNSSTVTVTVTVLEMKSTYVDMDTIDAEVDKVLNKIIKDGMTQLEQVKAIYKWVRNNCTYSSAYHFKDDWRQAGYMMLTGRYGDCYYYFGATKLMLERLNIPNIDVKKVPNYEGDSNHYWHLVSVDGGENYYHVDTTPRKVSTYFCMVTDKHMDDFSAKYRNCFNRDKSLYPATPETTPW